MAKITSKGTVIKLSISASFTTIAGVEMVTAPKAKAGVVKVTDLSSSVGEEKIATGYVDSGECSFNGFFDPVAATHQAITDYLTTPATSSWKIIWSDAAVTEWPFSAIVTEFTPKAQVGEALKFDASLDVTGLVTYPT